MEAGRLRALVWLYKGLKAGQQFSRKAIEQRFNISSRTARRYIRILREIFEVPIIYDSQKNRYYCPHTSNNFVETELSKEIRKEI
jgi:predicted DNA-binding transcriptional regulator YafY